MERRDLHDHLKASCDSCKSRHSCVEGPCQICDVYCKTLSLLPNRRASENEAPMESKTIIQPKETLPKQDFLYPSSRLGDPIQTKPLAQPQEALSNHELLDSQLTSTSDLHSSNVIDNNESMDDGNVLIVGSANNNNEIGNENIGPLSNSVLGDGPDNSDIQPFELTSRLGDTQRVKEYPVATIDNGEYSHFLNIVLISG